MLPIKGMSCTSCSRAVELHLDKLDGIINKSVNHTSNSGEFTIDESILTQEQLIHFINQGHYKVEVFESQKKDTNIKHLPSCPLCKVVGSKVPNTVLRSNLKADIYKRIILEDHFIICMNPICSTAYYTTIHHQTIKISDLKRELYFKESSTRNIICYCNNVDTKQINEAVKIHQLTNWESVMSHYRAKVIEKCETLNPTGLCCRDLFEKVVKQI